MTELLEGVDATTPRANLYAKLRDAASELLNLREKLARSEHDKQDEKVGRLQEIEERVRAKYQNRPQDAVQLVVSSTEPEWAEVVDFLANFEDLLPIALHRVHEGAKLVADPDTTEVTP